MPVTELDIPKGNRDDGNLARVSTASSSSGSSSSSSSSSQSSSSSHSSSPAPAPAQRTSSEDDNRPTLEQQHQQYLKLQQLQQQQQLEEEQQQQQQLQHHQQQQVRRRSSSEGSGDFENLDSTLVEIEQQQNRTGIIHANNHDIPNKRPNTSPLNSASSCPVIASSAHSQDLFNCHSRTPSSSLLLTGKGIAKLQKKRSKRYSLDYFDSFTGDYDYDSDHDNTDDGGIARAFHPQQQQQQRVFYNSYLQPNAQFVGEQQSGKSRFRIKIEFKTVDLMNSLVTGFLQINGLTKDHSEIVTYFRGEIINNPLLYLQQGAAHGHGHNHIHQHQHHPAPPSLHRHDNHHHHCHHPLKKFSFMSENSSWGSHPQNDLEHWKKLTNSSSLSNQECRDKLKRIYQGERDEETGDHLIYMRWKEEFLLPDSRVKSIPNASFEGFYYIVLNIGGGGNHSSNGAGAVGGKSDMFRSGGINGLYYHNSSEKFQSLSLQYVQRQDHGVFDFN
ncbi:uncharacterized protein LODBEIA_P34630 [Lodderomyces beijingensis]|uniref:Uncharacterized protein n=1 Tax=Lodderomyces beijingensis TaxID=1775926 RepID=A0ABP0ZM74_9ASCO